MDLRVNQEPQPQPPPGPPPEAFPSLAALSRSYWNNRSPLRAVGSRFLNALPQVLAGRKPHLLPSLFPAFLWHLHSLPPSPWVTRLGQTCPRGAPCLDMARTWAV